MIMDNRDDLMLIDEESTMRLLTERATQKKGSNIGRLYQYTTFDSLMSIIKNKAFRLSRTDFLNDKAELKLGNSDKAKHHYVMSMTESKEYVSMWAMYGRPSGIKVRVSFSRDIFLNIIDNLKDFSGFSQKVIPEYYIDEKGFLRKAELATCDLGFVEQKETIRFANVVYYDKRKNTLNLGGRPLTRYINFDEKKIDVLTGFVKYVAWEFEREKRLLIELNDNSREYIFLPINNELIHSFEITFNPWMTNEMKETIKNRLNELAGVKLKYNDSINDGEIDENKI